MCDYILFIDALKYKKYKLVALHENVILGDFELCWIPWNNSYIEDKIYVCYLVYINLHVYF